MKGAQANGNFRFSIDNIRAGDIRRVRNNHQSPSDIAYAADVGFECNFGDNYCWSFDFRGVGAFDADNDTGLYCGDFRDHQRGRRIYGHSPDAEDVPDEGLK